MFQDTLGTGDTETYKRVLHRIYLDPSVSLELIRIRTYYIEQDIVVKNWECHVVLVDPLKRYTIKSPGEGP